MSEYLELTKAVLEEHRKVLLAVKEEETEKLLEAIAAAKCIQVFGMGRMKCAVRAFVMRLMHMGLDAHVVYDTTCPNIGPGDLLIVNDTRVIPAKFTSHRKTGARIEGLFLREIAPGRWEVMLKNASLLTLAYPLFALGILVVTALVTALSALLVFILLATVWMPFIAILNSRATMSSLQQVEGHKQRQEELESEQELENEQH